MDFGAALYFLRQGERMARAAWGDAGMWVALQEPDAHSKMGLPYLYLHTVHDVLVPWTASQTDLLADDWEHVDDGPTESNAVEADPLQPAPLGPHVTVNVHVAGSVLSERELRGVIEQHLLQCGMRNSRTYAAYQR
ncbi:DUF2829 domain-containing protein [Peterkaempfera griseoplana]|uniref:DUF2829 domain-containing protein n=1 Tax=Peterkaempfera griseoplana TaxID=66896 RepID=UPI00099F3C46|nr:DUF2829 domain-containing protein [Peterkaempfera griseoplana]